MNEFRYRVVDVFTERALEGNPLAVFPDYPRIDDRTMQRIAKELNLSETVFIQRPTHPDCAAALRIFTPWKEMPFAGHPTVGASFVLLDEGIVQRDSQTFTLEEKIGPIPIRVERNGNLIIWLTTPPISFGKTFDPAVCADALGVDKSSLLDITPQVVSAGNPALFIALRTRADVDRAWLDASGIRRLSPDPNDSFLVFVFSPISAGAYSRMFAPDHGVVEDPATGSATGPLAAYMLHHSLLPENRSRRFISEQGTKMGRRSLLHFEISGHGPSQEIAVGGHVAPIIEAVMKLDV